MRTRKTVAFGMAVVFATSMMQSAGAGAQSLGTISGTANKEAKKPYTGYSVRARNVQAGSIASTVQLDAAGKFELAGVDAGELPRGAGQSQGQGRLHGGSVRSFEGPTEERA